MSRQECDHYAVLGVDRAASVAEIGRAYRRAARATHPDVHPDEPRAGERFTAVTIAYETLSDPGRRATYDRAHPADGAAPTIPRSRRLPVEPIHLGQSGYLSAPRWWAPQREYRIPRADVFEREFVELARALVLLRRSGWRTY